MSTFSNTGQLSEIYKIFHQLSTSIEKDLLPIIHNKQDLNEIDNIVNKTNTDNTTLTLNTFKYIQNATEVFINEDANIYNFIINLDNNVKILANILNLISNQMTD